MPQCFLNFLESLFLFLIEFLLTYLQICLHFFLVTNLILRLFKEFWISNIRISIGFLFIDLIFLLKYTFYLLYVYFWKISYHIYRICLKLIVNLLIELLVAFLHIDVFAVDNGSHFPRWCLTHFLKIIPLTLYIK
jgi:hypothetical protein